MKKDLHPQYYPNAKIRCACGAVHTIGATRPEINVEICARCHPFFTGEEKLIDTAGRVEKFRTRRAKASAHTNVRKSTKVRKKKPKL